MGTITITHTRADGTLLEGSSKGDGVLDLARPFGFRWFPSLGCLGITRSRDRAAQMWRINGAKAALEAAGWTVEVTVDEGTARSFAEAEAEREQRAEDRAERYAERAGRAQAASDAGYRSAHAVAEHIPPGQPVLRGHHSEGAHRRALARMDSGMRRHIDGGKRAEHNASRAETAAGYAGRRNDLGRTLRRIDGLEADRRRVERSLSRCTPGSDYARELERQRAEIDEQLAHWRAVVERHEAEGAKVFSRADFKRGDFVRYRGTWYEVLRVNPKSVTIPHGFNAIGRNVVRKGDGPHPDLTWTAGYHDGVTGRMSAEEMADKTRRAAGTAEGEGAPE
ncbi:DUF3560 domain-containing protein [Streptomyces sp. NPDC017936]|uniref:DUF3560 domain-containing protein n=1 Tax=Streptomyces sp. NPDC017936 TaxID=3365016 RepID=UPI003793C71C